MLQGNCEEDKCPTPGMESVGKSPTTAWGVGDGHSWNRLMHNYH